MLSKKRPSGERFHAKTFIAILYYHFEPSDFSSKPSHDSLLQRNYRQLQQQRRASRQESFRVISTARLRTLPPVHLPPINVVVCNDPNMEILS